MAGKHLISTEKPKPIPPLSIVRFDGGRVRKWKSEKGRVYRVGYYSRKQGLDCIWLVDDEGNYSETTDHEFLYRYYDVIHFADNKNLYGAKRPHLPPIRPADARRARRTRRTLVAGGRGFQ